MTGGARNPLRRWACLLAFLVTACTFAPAGAQLSLEPGTTAGLDIAVTEVPAGWLTTGSGTGVVTTNANNTTATIDVQAEHTPGIQSATATEGTCTNCATTSNLDADDGLYVAVASSGVLTHRATLEVTTEPAQAPFDDQAVSIRIEYRGGASKNVVHNLEVYNQSSAAWQTVATGQFQAESELLGDNAVAAHWMAADATVRARVRTSLASSTGYTLNADQFLVTFSTANGTVTWSDVLRFAVASDEASGVEISAEHVGVTNAARIQTASLWVGAPGTRVLLYGNGTVEEELATWVAIGAGTTAALDVRAHASGGSPAAWTFDIAVRQPAGGWRTLHHVDWRLPATT